MNQQKRGPCYNIVTLTLWTQMVRMTSIVNTVKIPFTMHLFTGYDVNNHETAYEMKAVCF